VDDEQRKRLEFFLNQKKLLGELNSEDDFEKLSELGDVRSFSPVSVIRIPSDPQSFLIGCIDPDLLYFGFKDLDPFWKFLDDYPNHSL